jgi:Tfp pilus assembly protein PilO
MKNTTALFLLVLSVGLFYTFTSPTYGDAQNLAITASEQKDVLQNISRIIETRDKLLVSYNSVSRAEIERLSKVLPQNVDTVRLAYELDIIAGKYGITVGQVAIDTQSEQNANQVVLAGSGDYYKRALVRVKFVSTYQNFRNFLADVEKSLRIMDVRSVNFRTAESGLYEHEILIETYWVE